MSKLSESGELAGLVALIERCAPGSEVDWSSGASVTITHDGLPEQMDISFFVHFNHPAGYTASPYSGGEIPPTGLLHYWVSWTLLDDHIDRPHRYKRQRICHDLSQVEQELTAWVAPEQPTPAHITIVPVPAPVRQTWPVVPPRPELEDSSTAMDDATHPALTNDLDKLDWPRLVAHWPVASDGTPLLKGRILLGAYGPATIKRQPCLIIRGPATKRDLKAAQAGQPGGFHLTLSDEFMENQEDCWITRPAWWTSTGTYDEPAVANDCRMLLAAGSIIQACDLAEVTLTEDVRRAAAGLPLDRYRTFDPAWVPILHATLARLGPWLLKEGLLRIEARLVAANKRPPKRGTWSRRLIDFPGQRQQAKCGLHATLLFDGQACLDIVESASNARLPRSGWTDPCILLGTDV